MNRIKFDRILAVGVRSFHLAVRLIRLLSKRRASNCRHLPRPLPSFLPIPKNGWRLSDLSLPSTFPSRR